MDRRIHLPTETCMKYRIFQFKNLIVCTGLLCLTQCSINLQDPQDKLDDIINAENASNYENLIGEWESVSFQLKNTDNPSFISNVKFEILRDHSYLIEDPSGILFNNSSSGNTLLNTETSELELEDSQLEFTLVF